MRATRKEILVCIEDERSYSVMTCVCSVLWAVLKESSFSLETAVELYSRRSGLDRTSRAKA